MKRNKVYVGYKPFSWQLDVHKILEECPTKTILSILSRRQCGKSMMAANILLERAINSPDSIGIYVAPTFKQCKKFYNELYTAISRSKIIRSYNKSDFELLFINGSRITCLSAAQRENLRGYTVKGSFLIVDEAAFISDSIFDIIQPFTNVHKATTILISTPLFTQGKFYESFQKGLAEMPGYKSISFNDYDTSVLLSKELLELYRQNVPENVFKTEYLGEFIKGGGLVFKNFAKCIVNLQVQDKPKYVGIDWATGEGTDSTIITFMTDKCEVIRQEKFKNMSPSEMIDRVAASLNRYSNLAILSEKNSIGSVFSDVVSTKLKNTSNKIEHFVTSNESKKQIIDGLIYAFDNNLITIPNDKLLIQELEVFSSKYNSEKRLLTYGAPSGMNDDRVISLALAYHSKNNKKGQYNISFL